MTTNSTINPKRLERLMGAVCEVLADSAEQAIRKAGMTLVQKLQKQELRKEETNE